MVARWFSACACSPKVEGSSPLGFGILPLTSLLSFLPLFLSLQLSSLLGCLVGLSHVEFLVDDVALTHCDHGLLIRSAP